MERATLRICCTALAMSLAACNKKDEASKPTEPVNLPSPTATAATPTPSPTPAATPAADVSPTKDNIATLLAHAVEGTRDIRFGNLQLDGALISATDKSGATVVELYWESLVQQPLTYTVLVHAVNDKGDILAEADHPQDASAKTAKAVEIWKDPIHLSAEQLKGARAVAIGLYHPGSDMLKADKGRRDWNNVRLWIPLPSNP